MKKLIILFVLLGFTSAMAENACLENPETCFSADSEEFDMITIAPSSDLEVKLSEIIKALEIAKRLIDPVNKVYAIESGAALLIYQWPAKPSVELRAKADKLEQDEKDYDFMISILDKLQKIQGD